MNWSSDFQFGPLPRVVFGNGRAREAGQLARELGGTAALLMTDPALYRLGLTQPIETALREADVRVEVFSDVATEPTLASVEAAVAQFHDRSCDIVVAVGGGSSMDSAKAVSLLVGNGGKFSDYTQRRVGTDWRPAKPVEKKGPPVMTVPTTAGTGSDVTSGLWRLRSGNRDQGLGRWTERAPLLSLGDPVLTTSMPPRVTADTGFDALSQGIEAVVTRTWNPYADALLLKAIEAIGNNLPKAFANGANLEARGAMMWAATMVGTGFPAAG